jgi:glycosyltransferase involved in cell wall biosynthesis
LLVRIGSVDAWADSLKHLLLDRETRRSMGANGRSRYLARFGHERMLDRVTALYGQIAA